jgi:pilus assembly protein Flp/PilA
MRRYGTGTTGACSHFMFSNAPLRNCEIASSTTGTSMTRALNLIKRLTADENGAAMIEYTVLIGILLTSVMLCILAIGNWVNTKWTALNTALTG